MKNPTLREFAARWSFYYENLYNGTITESYAFVELGLFYIRETFNELANRFCAARLDPMTSDREIEAFARVIIEYQKNNFRSSEINNIK